MVLGGTILLKMIHLRQTVEITFQLCLHSLNISLCFFTAEGVLALLPWPSSDEDVITWHLKLKSVLSLMALFPS